MKPKGKTKSTTLSPESQKARNRAKVNAKRAKESVTEKCNMARQALAAGDLDAANEWAMGACKLLNEDSVNTEPIELLGEIRIEMGSLETAKECFLEAVRRREVLPLESLEFGDEGKYLWLGQLSTAEEAVDWYTKGTEILLRILDRVKVKEEQKVKRKLCEIYCSLVELYLTDLWYVPLHIKLITVWRMMQNKKQRNMHN